MPHPVAGFARFDQHGISLVVGAQYELTEKLDLTPVFSFCFRLVTAGCRKVLDAFGVFAAVQ